MLRRFLLAAFACLLLPLQSMAMETKPWFGSIFEFEFRSSYTHSSYDNVKVGASSVHHSSTDHLVGLSLGVAPAQRWAVEAELLTAKTRHQDFSAAHIAATGRYLVWNECIGDPFSVTTGATLTLPIGDSAEDISLGYHGDVELLLHGAFGREFAWNCDRLARGWAVAGLGFAPGADPWFVAELNIEADFCDCWQLLFFVKGDWGMGDRDIDLSQTFRSYKEIDYRTVDVGIRYSHRFLYCGTLSLEYAGRIDCRNAPEDVHRFTISFLLPFSL